MDGQAFEELYDKAKKTEYKIKQLRKEKDKKRVIFNCEFLIKV